MTRWEFLYLGTYCFLSADHSLLSSCPIFYNFSAPLPEVLLTAAARCSCLDNRAASGVSPHLVNQSRFTVLAWVSAHIHLYEETLVYHPQDLEGTVQSTGVGALEIVICITSVPSTFSIKLSRNRVLVLVCNGTLSPPRGYPFGQLTAFACLLTLTPLLGQVTCSFFWFSLLKFDRWQFLFHFTNLPSNK